MKLYESAFSLCDVFLSGKYSDTTFLVGPKSVEVRGHKAVLAVASDYFVALFNFPSDNGNTVPT